MLVALNKVGQRLGHDGKALFEAAFEDESVFVRRCFLFHVGPKLEDAVDVITLDEAGGGRAQPAYQTNGSKW